MRYWLNQFYSPRITLCGLPMIPTKFISNKYRYWWWRNFYLGMLCDEFYSRTVEHVSRRVLIIPAICMFDKHLSKFMNARIITTAFEALNYKIYKENLTTLDLMRIIISIVITALICFQLLHIL